MVFGVKKLHDRISSGKIIKLLGYFIRLNRVENGTSNSPRLFSDIQFPKDGRKISEQIAYGRSNVSAEVFNCHPRNHRPESNVRRRALPSNEFDLSAFCVI